MTFRTIDLEVCTWTVRAGRGVGTHFLWHTLNGLLLYVLLLGAIRHGAQGRLKARMSRLHSVRSRLITARRGRGGTGRHTGLKILRRQRRLGSTPGVRTKSMLYVGF